MRAWLEAGDRRAALALVLQLVACWPAWTWYAARLMDGANEPWGVAALVTAAILPARRRSAAAPVAGSLLVPTLLLALYAASFRFVPPLLSTLLAMAAAGVTYSVWRHGTAWPSARWGLVLLSVPMLTSVHFYLGYPLRVVTGTLATILLQLSGFNVVREGVCLKWAGHLVMVDAPCSGVRMLWAATFLVLALASRRGRSAGRTVLVTSSAVAIVLAGNALRTAALFFPEAGVLHPPAGFHSAVGLAVFVAVAAGITWCCFRPQESH